MLRAQEFLMRMQDIKREFSIKVVRRGNDTTRRRVAIIVVDEFLMAGGGIHQALFVEANLYHNLKQLNLSCDPTPEEARLRQLRRQKRTRISGFNPLKLASENIEAEDYEPYSLTKAIINILPEEKEGQNELSGNHKGRGPARTFRYLQKNAQLFKKQKGPSFYRAH